MQQHRLSPRPVHLIRPVKHKHRTRHGLIVRDAHVAGRDQTVTPAPSPPRWDISGFPALPPHSVLLTTSVLGPLLVLQVLPPFSLIVDMPLVAAQSQDLVLLEGWEGQVVLQAMYRHLVMLPAGGMMGTCGG